MKKTSTYATLISLTVLFLFLSLLFLRMHCKLIYKGENQLSQIISEAYKLGDEITTNDGNNTTAKGNFLQLYLKNKDFLDNYVKNNPDAREDYLYTIISVSDDVETIYDYCFNNKDQKTSLHVNHLRHLNNEHKSSLVFCIICSLSFVVSTSVFVVYIIKNKPKFEEIINHETSK